MRVHVNSARWCRLAAQLTSPHCRLLLFPSATATIIGLSFNAHKLISFNIHCHVKFFDGYTSIGHSVRNLVPFFGTYLSILDLRQNMNTWPTKKMFDYSCV